MEVISTSYSNFKFFKIYQVCVVLLPMGVSILSYFLQRDFYDLHHKILGKLLFGFG